MDKSQHQRRGQASQVLPEDPDTGRENWGENGTVRIALNVCGVCGAACCDGEAGCAVAAVPCLLHGRVGII